MFGTHVQIAVFAVAAAVLGAQGLKNLPSRNGAAKHQAAATSAKGYGEYRIAADSVGQYSTSVDINGARIEALVDTGATFVVLSHEDAVKARVSPNPGDYTKSVSTANGTVKVARVTLQDVRVGSLVLSNVEALVGPPGALSTTLLGMSFLGRLSKIEVASGALLLKQ